MRVERLVAFCRFAVAAAAVAALLFLAAVPASAEKPPPPPAAHAADADGDKIFDDLERRIRSADVDQTFPAIVLLDQPSTSDGINGLHRRIGDFNVNSQYSTINGFAAKLTKGQIVALSRLDQVAQIEADLPVKASLDTATYWFGVQNARTDFGVDGNADGQPAYGTGDIVTAILDTGIDNAHVDLDGGKVVAWADLHQPVDPVNDPFCNSPCDPHSHGTHVSSIVAGEGEGNALYGGVAPGAALVGVRVLDRYGSGSTSTINAGIQWVIDNKDTYNIRIINMSLGSSGCSDGTDSMSQMVNQAVAAGIVVVVAAGNSGPAACTVSSPAAAEDAITVAAMADIGEAGFSLANFSSRGPTADGRIKPDISGPGVRVTAARSGTGSSYVSYSGTSMATPFVAGVAALMLDADPTLTPNEVKSLVMNTAVDWGPTGKDTDYGAGRLDAYEAVRTAKNASGTNIDVPNHQTVEGALATAGQPGDSDTYTIDITDATKPLAITLVMSTWSSSGDVDFDMELRDKDGVQVAISDWVDRQETIGITSPANGPYTLRVYAWSGSGPYFFDISVGGSIASAFCALVPEPGMIGDFDGDGEDDVVNYHSASGTWCANVSTGSGFVGETWATFRTKTGWEPQLVGDFNGDGKDDVVNYHPGTGTWWVNVSTGSGFVPQKWATFRSRIGWEPQLVGDFNGDGKDDVVNYHPASGTWWVNVSTGTGFVPELWTTFSSKRGWEPQLVGDFSGDGRDDVVNYHPASGTWWVNVSKAAPDRFEPQKWTTFRTKSGWDPQLVGDFSGDGKDDVVNYHSRTGRRWVNVSTGLNTFQPQWWR